MPEINDIEKLPEGNVAINLKSIDQKLEERPHTNGQI